MEYLFLASFSTMRIFMFPPVQWYGIKLIPNKVYGSFWSRFQQRGMTFKVQSISLAYVWEEAARPQPVFAKLSNSNLKDMLHHINKLGTGAAFHGTCTNPSGLFLRKKPIDKRKIIPSYLPLASYFQIYAFINNHEITKLVNQPLNTFTCNLLACMTQFETGPKQIHQ